MKIFDFDNGVSENINHTPALAIWQVSKTLQGEEEFHSKNHLLEMPFSHAKICLKSAPQQLSFAMAKAVSKSYTLDYSCKYSGKFPDSYVY